MVIQEQSSTGDTLLHSYEQDNLTKQIDRRFIIFIPTATPITNQLFKEVEKSIRIPDKGPVLIISK